MRWDEQRVENDLKLPGMDEGGLVRTFDAPEAMGINFHEVHARSALNHVPGGRFGFNYTINAFRGCTHACAFCLEGSTQILMANGSTKPLADVRVGDAIYGTVRRGNYRRYHPTTVLAHWMTKKKDAYRITLEDGTRLIASGDHRFLTDRGWKHVSGSERGSGRRPHLTLNNKLIGVGALGPIRTESAEYRRGYLCGMIRGDGHVGSYAYDRPGRTNYEVHRFRLALTDDEALMRASTYLRNVGIRTTRSIAGIALKSQAKLGVVSIEPLPRRIDMFDITTGTGDFIANGVVSHNCFARRTHTFLDFDADRDFEREIVVKVNVAELLRAELARPSWKREVVAIGTNTDPYQWVESRYRFMPEILTALDEANTPVSVLTKSPLLLRDIDLYERMAQRLPISVNLSVPTLDEKVWRATEPHTPSPMARLEAVAELRRRGIDSGVLIAPLMPGINDSPEQVQPIVDLAREAGATFLGGVALHLRDEVRDVFFGWLDAKRPDLIPRYEQLYSRGRAYMRPEQRKRTTRAVRGWGRARQRTKGERQSPQLADTQSRRPSGGDLSGEGAAAHPPPQASLF